MAKATDKLLTAKQRLDIGKRNRDNADVAALLAEGDALRRLLARAQQQLAVATGELAAEIKSNRQKTAKLKRLLASATKKLKYGDKK